MLYYNFVGFKFRAILRDIILLQNAVIGPLVTGNDSATCSPMGPRAAESKKLNYNIYLYIIYSFNIRNKQ